MDINELNSDFGIENHLAFLKGDDGLIYAHLKNSQGCAVISTYAAQVLSFKPGNTHNDLLFVSEKAFFETGKAIKGGIPVCWPWFGPDPQDQGRAAHGFVRTRQWQVVSTTAIDAEHTQIVLGIDSDDQTYSSWPFEFQLRIEITVGKALQINLLTTNNDSKIIELSQALHSYFSTTDITQTQVHGLDGKTYLDKLDAMKNKTQQGVIQFNQAVDRIYTAVEEPVSIYDPVLKQRVDIVSSGSKSTVVWNPWSKQAVEMTDFRDDDYLKMLCVETANAGPDVVKVKPGETYRLGMQIQVDTA